MTYSSSRTRPVVGTDRKLEHAADSELARAVRLYQQTYCPKRSLGSFWSDPFGTIISAPATAIDAAAGGPQQRARAHAATAAAATTQKQIDAEKASRDAAVAASTAAAQQDVAATTAAAKAAAKKKLIKTLAIGGGAFAVLAVALVLVTGKSEPALKKNAKLVPVDVFTNEDERTEARVFDLGPRGFSVALVDLDADDSDHTVGVRIFPREQRAQATSYARKIAGV